MQKFPGFRIRILESRFQNPDFSVWLNVLCYQYEDLLTVAQTSFSMELHGVLAKKKSVTVTKALADVQRVSLIRKISFPGHCCCRQYWLVHRNTRIDCSFVQFHVERCQRPEVLPLGIRAFQPAYRPIAAPEK